MAKRVLSMMEQYKQIFELKVFKLLFAIVVFSKIGPASWAGLASAYNESAKKSLFVFLKLFITWNLCFFQYSLAAIKNNESYFGVNYGRNKKTSQL